MVSVAEIGVPSSNWPVFRNCAVLSDTFCPHDTNGEACPIIAGSPVVHSSGVNSPCSVMIFPFMSTDNPSLFWIRLRMAVCSFWMSLTLPLNWPV